MLQNWKKIGEPITMAGKFGKKLITQIFINPKTNKEEEYVLFAQKDWSVVLAVTMINNHPHVLIVREYKQGRDSVDTELPAGTAGSDGESHRDIIQRELIEETGYKAGQLAYLGHAWIATRNSPTKFHCYLATECVKVDEQNLDENEIIEMGLVPWESWIQMVQNGTITEPSAVVATVRSLPLLNYQIASK